MSEMAQMFKENEFLRLYKDGLFVNKINKDKMTYINK